MLSHTSYFFTPMRSPSSIEFPTLAAAAASATLGRALLSFANHLALGHPTGRKFGAMYSDGFLRNLIFQIYYMYNVYSNIYIIYIIN